MKKESKTVGVNLTLPDELHAAVKIEAAKARKSMKAWMLEALRAATKTARAA